VDLIWTSRPPVPHTGVEPFLDVYAGETALQKIDRIAQGLKDKGHAAAFLSDPSDLAWLLNVRGRDVPHTPVALSCGVIYADKHIEWVIDPLRVPLELKKKSQPSAASNAA
jgi:Xaa-Pro aminopeptidase